MNLLLIALAKPILSLGFLAGFGTYRSVGAIELQAVEVREFAAPAPAQNRAGVEIDEDVLVVPVRPADPKPVPDETDEAPEE